MSEIHNLAVDFSQQFRNKSYIVSSMGGGGQTGGVVVGGPTPEASAQAAFYQQQAIQAAIDASKQQTNDAINLIRDQYNTAFSSLKPYTTEGIQALDELNAYMGLSPYNPGTAPTAPKQPTIQDYISSYTPQQIADFASQYIGFNKVPNAQGQMFTFPVYTGPGSYNNIPNMGNDGTSLLGTGKYTDLGGIVLPSVEPGGADNFMIANSAIQDKSIRDAIANAMAERDLKLGMKDYQSQMDSYNQQMDVYNYANQLYDQYNSQGPMTSQQVIDKLMNQPGVQFQYNQGLDAIQRAAASQGMIGSGRLLQSISDYGQGVAQQQYGDTLSRLATLAGMGQGAATGTAQIAQNLGNTTGQLTSNLGDTIANGYLARGNALSQALLSANQQYKVVGQQDAPGGGIGSALSGLGSLVGAFGGLF